jgi:hypothetical protein
MEVTVSEKHPSLLRLGIYYGRKKFYNCLPGVIHVWYKRLTFKEMFFKDF